MKFYHGTSDAMIASGLLLPPTRTGTLRESWREKLLDKVFLTISLRSAEMYAKKACEKYGGKPVVYVAKPLGGYIMNGVECLCDVAQIVCVVK